MIIMPYVKNLVNTRTHIYTETRVYIWEIVFSTEIQESLCYMCVIMLFLMQMEYILLLYFSPYSNTNLCTIIIWAVYKHEEEVIVTTHQYYQLDIDRIIILLTNTWWWYTDGILSVYLSCYWRDKVSTLSNRIMIHSVIKIRTVSLVHW